MINKPHLRREVPIHTDVLLGIIKKNLEKHRLEYAESVKGYRSKAIELIAGRGSRVIAELDAMKAEFERESDELPFLGLPTDLIVFDLERPQSHVSAYTAIIRMLELSADPITKLSSEEFAMYVLDEWDWKPFFDRVSTQYGGKAALALRGDL